MLPHTTKATTRWSLTRCSRPLLVRRMLETPVTSAPIVAGYLSNLPAYRTGVSPLLRGVEIGLAHGFFLVSADPGTS